MRKPAARGANSSFDIRHSPFISGFTLIELILVMALLVIFTSIATPAMSRFIRGRALDTEARRLLALTHLAQSRAVSEGMPMMLWVNEQADSYGFASEASAQGGDPKAETLNVDSTLAISVASTTGGVPTTFNNLPAIRFQADGELTGVGFRYRSETHLQSGAARGNRDFRYAMQDLIDVFEDAVGQ